MDLQKRANLLEKVVRDWSWSEIATSLGMDLDDHFTGCDLKDDQVAMELVRRVMAGDQKLNDVMHLEEIEVVDPARYTISNAVLAALMAGIVARTFLIWYRVSRLPIVGKIAGELIVDSAAYCKLVVVWAYMFGYHDGMAQSKIRQDVRRIFES